MAPSNPTAVKRRSSSGEGKVGSAAEPRPDRVEKHQQCDVCNKTPYKGTEMLLPLIPDQDARAIDLDGGIYEYIYRMTSPEQQNESTRVDAATAKKTMDRCARHIRKLRAELTKAGILQTENQRYSGQNDSARVIAPFSMEELRLGALLGKGGFSSVFEIDSFRLDPDLTRSLNTHEREARDYLADNVREKQVSGDGKVKDPQGVTKYAIKHLRMGLAKEPERFERAAIDLVLEAQLLLCMDHPNIVSLRGWSAQGETGYRSGYTTSFFVIIDRLPETLEDRIFRWRGDVRKYKGRVKLPWAKKAASEKLDHVLMERIQVSLDVATATEYMHERRIINRDLKASNIGFDVHGELKLFDFGLSRLLPSKKKNKEESYLMSRVGTKYYMAPEIRQKIPYGVSADVYSFGVCFWEILSMGSPREALKGQKDNSTASRCPLPICKCWPATAAETLEACLSIAAIKRPTITKVKKRLTQLLESWGAPTQRTRRRRSLRVDLSSVENTSQATSEIENAGGPEEKKEIRDGSPSRPVGYVVDESEIDNAAFRLPRTTESGVQMTSSVLESTLEVDDDPPAAPVAKTSEAYKATTTVTEPTSTPESDTEVSAPGVGSDSQGN